MKSTTLKTTYIGLLITLMAMFSSIRQAEAQNNISQTTETIDGITYIIHKIQAKETYYQLSRIYDVAVSDIMSANNKKSLRAGDTARIPSPAPRRAEEPRSTTTAQGRTNNIPSLIDAADILTEYKVGASETLFSIAKRFQTTVADIKTLNNLKSDLLREGQLLKIPDGELPRAEPTAPVQPVAPPVIELVETEEPKNLTARDFDAKRLGIRETSEKGIGVWMTNLETRNNSNLALHKTAPVGTVLKITNPITKSVTYAKVVGKFADNTDTQNAIVVLSRSAASYIGAVDKRFVVEITYGLPVE